ncbi:Radical SAM domain protein [Desulfovibrio sp. X2]|uniref:radical SAM protein n=1 Tax=Desulfovibrio sp. X2 TaxID=941449 RepID=UPI000358CE79|nr:radical SAM protein [Desulfovibrio sp. X2]EPR44442.1 Radical SAM domain protein [Desulfovibrio sp. X2]
MTSARERIHFLGAGRPELPDPGGRLPTALVFAGEESLALSTLGWQAAWRILADLPGLRVERVFLPGPNEAPASADSGIPLSDFPLLAASVNFEEEFKALAEMLLAAEIPLRRTDRPDWPLVLIGGPVAFLNPAPLMPLADAFFVGEAEAGLAEAVAVVRDVRLAGGGKDEAIARLERLPGVLVPGRTPLPVRRVVAGGITNELSAPCYSTFVSPRSAFRDMFLVEVNRGCPYGCRFCAAGSIYRPPRHATLEGLKDLVEQAAPQKVGLVGTALTDWPDLRAFLEWLKERKTKFSLSSVRADGLSDDFLTFLRDTGLRTLTLALEAPSERLRRAAGKRLDTGRLLEVVSSVSRLQFNKLKLYLIVGWPGETDADYEEFGDFLAEFSAARERGRGKKGKGLDVAVLSVAPLVPKPWTPLQWSAMRPEAELAARLDRLRALCRPHKGLRLEGESPFAARLQGLLTRGDEALFDLIELAARQGTWRKALAEWDGDMARYLDRERSREEPFPWEVVDTGVSRAYLWREWQAYLAGKEGVLCPDDGCGSCGRCGLTARASVRSKDQGDGPCAT